MVVVVGCKLAAGPSETESEGTADAGVAPGDYETDPLAGLPAGFEQWRRLCDRGHGDAVSIAFCASEQPPAVSSLAELQSLLALVPTDPATSHALVGHSSSLVMRLSSQINPRAILFTRPSAQGTSMPNATYTAMGFVRGEQFVELLANDPTADGELRFFLFRFRLECNETVSGCTWGDLLTPAVESGFSTYTLYGEEDLSNTVFDCRQCHQPAGPNTPKLLRMQELKPGWTHWLFDEPAGPVALCDDFMSAHDGETYAGIPFDIIVAPTPELDGAPGCRARAPYFAGPLALESLVENNGFEAQPNRFESDTVLAEVRVGNPDQPGVNVPPGVSSTWRQLYANYLSGGVIPPPYHDTKVTDEVKLASMTAAYRAVASGAMPTASLPDITDVYLDAALPDMTIRAQPGSTAQEILVQMCQQCHNSRLDQTITRARFNVQRLSEMSLAERQKAAERIRLPKDHANHMPPSRFRELSDEEIELVAQALQE